MTYTFKKAGSNVEVYEDGNRVSTGSPAYAKSLGYTETTPELTLPDAPVVGQALPTTPSTAPGSLELPATAPSGKNLVSFKDSLNAAMTLAAQKRNALALQLAMPGFGKVDSSSFTGILDSLNQASNSYAKSNFGDTLQEAIGLKQGKLETSVVEVNGKKLLINSQTGETIKDLGRSKAPGSGSGKSGNKLTLSEVTERGLPTSLVGTYEEDAYASANPPQWFLDRLRVQSPGLLASPSVTQDAWDRAKVLGGSKPVAAKPVKADANTEKAAAYFEKTYEDTDAETIQYLAEKVKEYVAEGYSYAAALKKVEDEEVEQ